MKPNLFPSFTRLSDKGVHFLLAGLLLAQAGCSTPLSTDPVNTRLQLSGLPPVEGPQNQISGNSQLFSFRIITPIKNVDLFSILQAKELAPTSAVNAGLPLRQTALPVGQLKEVIAAKKLIESSEFLQPQLANTLAFDTARLFNWDTEVARQVLVEVVRIYTTHRDREVVKWREGAEERAQQYIKKSIALQNEKTRQDQDLYKRIYNPKPGVNDRDVKNPGLASYINYSKDALARNKRASDEYSRQAKAAHEEYLTKLKAQMERDRKKKEMDAILAQDRIKNQLETFKTQAVNSEKPYYLHALSNGDFMLEANGDNALPAVIQLRVEGFSDPVSIPILEQTNNGRLLVSIDKDQQGRPVVRGGMDNATGNTLNLQEALFTLRYLDQSRQQLDFLFPDGQVHQFDVSKLEALSRWDQQPSLVPPVVSRLSAPDLRLKQEAFSQIQYEFIPILNQMPPEQALDILQTVQEQF
jgi:hypothetical protein